jgi:hypothetical protein
MDLTYDRFHRIDELGSIRDWFARRDEQARRVAEDDRRNQAQIDAAKRVEIQSRYDEIFARYPGQERAPAPVADEAPMDYQYRLMKLVKGKLGREDDRRLDPRYTTTVGDVARTRLGDMNDVTLRAWENNLLAAGQLQARQPHRSTLGAPGTFTERVVVDEATGQKKREFYGKTSFIKEFSNPARTVLRIIDPRHAKVIYGMPYSRVPE